MHQPRYVHPLTGRTVLPWVRLHASSGYLDMARALERHPEARVTVNFVPSLVEQLEAVVAGARDDLEELATRSAADLDDAARLAVLLRSFSVRWDRVIAPRPRYAELLHKRGRDGRAEVLAGIAPHFTAAELDDLQCLFLLGWLGTAAREDEPAIDELDRKGQGYSADDKAVLLGAVRRAAAKVLPAWRRLAERGQIELATSPYFHPIIPLLVNTDSARRARPDDELPTRMGWPADARAQIASALAAHERVFGVRPAGMWPPEGSLSPEAVEAYAACGVSWLAGDEETLARSLYGDVAGWPPPRARLWRHGDVALVFRDRELSDRIGFRYADLPAKDAAEDLIASARARAGDRGLVGIFLDGENAWEAYPRRGADFLDALYAGLERAAQAGQARSRTISEAIAEHAPGQLLPRLHSGSWIDAAFRIWIGDPEKNRAWTQLGEARARLTAAEAEGHPGVPEATRLLHAAEGSDWFWWYGEPFSSAEDPVFDELFRAHLQAAWLALGEAPPPGLATPIGLGGIAVRAQPTALIHPRVDGRVARYWDWQGAARHEVGRGAVMAEGAHAVERVHVGFDHERLYLRLDPVRGDQRRVCATHLTLHVGVAGGGGGGGGEHEVAVRVDVGAADGGPGLRAVGGQVGAIDVVALAIPFAALGARPRDRLRLWLTHDFAGLVYARVPRDGVLLVVVPWPGWEAEHWTA